MKISIVTVTFNSEKTIADTIESVLGQSYKNIEYLLVDGASQDKTIDIIHKYKEISKFLSEEDTGIYNALNKGIKMAQGDVIGLLHSDDIYPNNLVIEKVMRHFSKNPDLQALYGDLIYMTKDMSRIHRNWKAKEYKEGDFIKGWMPPHPSFFVRRKVYTELGGFNESFKLAADYELMLRFIHKHKINIEYLPEVLVHMRTGGASNISIKNRILANKEDRRAWSVNDLNPNFLTLYRKPIQKIFQFFNNK